MVDRFDGMTVLVAVAEAGSLSAAARRLGAPLTSVSRKLAALEARLGARLVQRTTRRLALTDEGRAFYERAKRILADVDEAELALGAARGAAAGRLVVSAPTLFGRVCLAPLLPAFLAAHPRVELTLEVSDAFVDVVAAGIDVALRIGALADSSLVARKLGEFRRLPVAAPGYLAGRPAPRRPAELAGHEAVAYTLLQEGADWRLVDGRGRESAVRVAARLRIAGADAAFEAALAGGGIALAPAWQAAAALADGRLVRVLPGYATRPVPIHAVYPAARLQPARARAFVDFLAARWAATDFDRLASGPAPGL